MIRRLPLIFLTALLLTSCRPEAGGPVPGTGAETEEAPPVLYSQYYNEPGGPAVDGLGILDVIMSGSRQISSLRIERPDGGPIAGPMSFIVLNTTCKGKNVDLAGGEKHFRVMMEPGTYSGLILTVCDSDCGVMATTLPAFSLEENGCFEHSLRYAPDEELVYYEHFDKFVWGGDYVGGESFSCYAPEAKAIDLYNFSNRTGYETAANEVPFNRPGGGYIQSAEWADVDGEMVARKHVANASYIESRGLWKWRYFYRSVEYQGYVGVGTESIGRGMAHTCALSNVRTLSQVKVSFDIAFKEDFNDDLLFRVFDGGQISSISMDGVLVPSDCIQKYFMVQSDAVIPYASLNADGKCSWHHFECLVDNASSSTELCWAGNSETPGSHGFFLDNIEVRRLGDMPRGNLRVLYWNIMNGLWTEQPIGYVNFVEWVKKYDPDICVFCEAASTYKDNTTDFAPRDERYLPDGWPVLAGKYGHNCTFLSEYTGDHPRVITSRIPLTFVKNVTSNGSDLAIMCRAEVGGRTVNIVGLHLSAGSTGTDRLRETEIKVIYDSTVKSSAYSSQNDWLMVGDFNSYSRVDNWYHCFPENGTRLLCHDVLRKDGYMKDILATRYPGAIMATYLNYSPYELLSRFDYAYASPSLYDSVVNATVLADDWIFNEFVFHIPSDHRPLLIDFEI